MSSLVYFKFKANVKTDSIPFDGSVISVKDLKHAIRTKCCLYSSDFELKLEDSTGKAYNKDDELIPKYTSLVVRRVPKLTTDGPKRKNNEDHAWKELQKAQATATDSLQTSKPINLADSDLPEEEKIKIMMERSSEAYSEKNFTTKAKPYGVPPPTYICHKCNQPGHWIHNCPGVRDNTGKMVDVKNLKRPTGIPQDFLLEVEAGTPGAYLGKSGKYMVPIKDAEAYAQGKKDKRPFSVEENPPYVSKEKTPPKHFICPLCNLLFRDAVLVSCCGSTYCNECIMGHVFDSQVLGSQKCPSCGAALTDHESSVFENALVRSLIRDWQSTESQLPDSNLIQIQKDVPEIIEKTFVNNRRVLKPKHAAANIPATQLKEEVVIEAHQETKPNVTELVDTKSTSDLLTTNTCSAVAGLIVSSPVRTCSTELSVAQIPPFVTSNTSASLTGSVACTTFGSRGPALLTSNIGLQNVQLSGLNYANSTSVIPPMLHGLSDTNHTLLNALYNMRVENLSTHLVAPQSVLPTPFQGALVAGTDWTTDSVHQNAGLADQVLHHGLNHTALGLVPGQAGMLPTSLSAPISTIDGQKVLSKEEFYRLKMEMLHSARRRLHHSRSRSPRRSHKRSSVQRSSHDRYSSPRRLESKSRHRSGRYYRDDDRYESRAAHRFRSVRGDSVEPEAYYEERRVVRSNRLRLNPEYRPNSHVKPESSSFSRVSVNSPHRRMYESIHHLEEPHGTDSDLYRRMRSRSPLDTSIVPQYNTSGSESETAATRRRSISGDTRRQAYSRTSDELANIRIQSETGTPLQLESTKVAEFTNSLEREEILVKKAKKDKKKDKKHRKHKHSKKGTKSQGVPVTADADGQFWVPDRSVTDNLENTLEVKPRKEKKHKHRSKDEKKEKRKHKHRISKKDNILTATTDQF